MARYSINGQILTDMADAIRANKGEVVSTVAGELATNGSVDYVYFPVTKGKKYKINITPTSITKDGIAYVYIYYTKSSSEKISPNKFTFVAGQTEEIMFETTKDSESAYISLAITTYGTVILASFTLEEVDADGNPLYVYAPEDMAAEVAAFADRMDPKFVEMITGDNDGASITELPEGITNIKSYAFDGMSKLKLTSLPDGLLKIGSYAFQECSSLGLTSLPDSITTLGSGAFEDALISLEALPENLTTVESYALSTKGTLPSTLIIPAGVTKIGATLFGFTARKNVTEIIFLGTPTSLGTSYSGAFGYQTQITSIKVPWSEGAVANAPWGATNATITYNYVHEEA